MFLAFNFDVKWKEIEKKIKEIDISCGGDNYKQMIKINGKFVKF